MVAAQHAMPHPDLKDIRSRVSAGNGCFFTVGRRQVPRPVAVLRLTPVGGAERHLTMSAIFPGSYPLTLMSRSR